MKNLIKADFKRLFKDKITIILFIVALVFAIITPLLQAALVEVQKMLMDAEEVIATTQAKSLIFSNFAYLSDSMVIILILVPILLVKELNGIIRNKIVNGYSRKQVYLSLFIVITIYLLILLICATILTTIMALIMYPYSLEGYLIIEDIPYLLLELLGAIILSTFISSLIMLFTIGLKIKVSSVLIIGSFFVLTLVANISVLAGSKESSFDILTIFNPCAMASSLGTTSNPLFYVGQTVIPLAYTALATWLGMLAFEKKDIN